MTLELGGGVPCFQLDLAHLHVLPELGQAVMANCTCLFPRDCHGSGRLLTICSLRKKKKGLKRRAGEAGVSAAHMAKSIRCSGTLRGFFPVTGPACVP